MDENVTSVDKWLANLDAKLEEAQAHADSDDEVAVAIRTFDEKLEKLLASYPEADHSAVRRGLYVDGNGGPQTRFNRLRGV